MQNNSTAYKSGDANSQTNEQNDQEAKLLGKTIEAKVMEAIVKQKRNGA